MMGKMDTFVVPSSILFITHTQCVNCHRYNVDGFVEELPRLPENRWRHVCALLPDTGVGSYLDPSVDKTNLQALVVAAGKTDTINISSVLTLLPGATAWTQLASLPRPLDGARASIVGGRLRLAAGYSNYVLRSEVAIENYRKVFFEPSLTLCSKYHLTNTFQVFEYHPEPWNEWATIGDLEIPQAYHAILSIKMHDLPCLSGKELK